MFYVVVEAVQKIIRIAVKDVMVVIVVVQQICEALAGGGESHGMRLHLVAHIRVDGLMVGVEADAAVVVVEVEHRVERVIIGGRLRDGELG